MLSVLLVPGPELIPADEPSAELTKAMVETSPGKSGNSKLSSMVRPTFPKGCSLRIAECGRRAERGVARGAPFGDVAWKERTARTLGLESALRLPGRPKKREKT